MGLLWCVLLFTDVTLAEVQDIVSGNQVEKVTGAIQRTSIIKKKDCVATSSCLKFFKSCFSQQDHLCTVSKFPNPLQLWSK